MKKIRWGILSTAKIGREKVIPALQQSRLGEVVAIASPTPEKLAAVAEQLGIPVTYPSYEALLADPQVDAVYIPLPNHLHVPWAIKAIEKGKHVLCEKPVALSVAEAMELAEAANRYPHIKIMEAFMYRFHPQWIHTKELIGEGRIGELRTVQSFFSYYNTDPHNIRNRQAAGGGGLMDIGCYCISFARYLFEGEPDRVLGMVEYDPAFKVDRMASGLLHFSNGTSAFTCSTQLMPYQRVNIMGTEGRIEIEIPVNAPPDKATRLWLHTKEGSEEIVFGPADQYALQGDAFAAAILNATMVPTPLKDAINNMKVIEALFSSVRKGAWVPVL